MISSRNFLKLSLSQDPWCSQNRKKNLPRAQYASLTVSNRVKETKLKIQLNWIFFKARKFSLLVAYLKATISFSHLCPSEKNTSYFILRNNLVNIWGILFHWNIYVETRLHMAEKAMIFKFFLLYCMLAKI